MKPLRHNSTFRQPSLEEVREKQAEKRNRARKPPQKPVKPNSRFSTLKRATGRKNRRNRGLRAKPDPQMAAWGRLVLKRDRNRCQWPAGCKTGDERIDPHHMAKRSQRPDKKYDPSNGIALCRTHHQWTDDHHDEAVAMGLLNLETYELAQRNVRE